jgi:hypothetical protein
MIPKVPIQRKRLKQQKVIETILLIVKFNKAPYNIEKFVELTLSQAINVKNKYHFILFGKCRQN